MIGKAIPIFSWPKVNLLIAIATAIMALLAASTTPSPNEHISPLSSLHLFVNPHTPALHQALEWEKAGKLNDAQAVRRVAGQPSAIWLSSNTAEAQKDISLYGQLAAEAGEAPVLVLYNLPQRDCGQFSAGGAHDGATYRHWIDAVAAKLSGPAVIILEPDAVAHTMDACADNLDIAQRYQLLHYAVDRLKSHPGVHVYLDAGNAAWISDLTGLADALQASGLDHSDGFALNTANFQTTPASIKYGRRLSDELGGAHFVIDTSRNGKGPWHNVADPKTWCNPPGRKLGENPTTTTGQARVDAYLWIKTPGESDGDCRPGEPKAGQWWAQYALGLVNNP